MGRLRLGARRSAGGRLAVERGAAPARCVLRPAPPPTFPDSLAFPNSHRSSQVRCSRVPPASRLANVPGMGGGRRVFLSYTSELARWPIPGQTWVAAAVEAVN